MSDYKCFSPDGSHLLNDEKHVQLVRHSVYAASSLSRFLVSIALKDVRTVTVIAMDIV